MTTPAYDDLDFVPQPFELPEEVVLPNGERLTGARARVYGLLQRTAVEGIAHRIGLHVGPAGWVPAFYFRKPWAGGNAGDRRLRDLRVRGVVLESDRWPGPEGLTNTWLWRWVSDPVAAPAFAPGDPQTSDLAAAGASAQLTERSLHGSQRHAQDGAFEFYTSFGFPGGHAPGRIEVTPGARGALAPPARIGTAAVRGLRPAACAERYLEELRLQWQRGEIHPVMRGGTWTLWIAPESPFDPLPTLVDVLTKLGAKYLGDWSSRQRAGEVA